MMHSTYFSMHRKTFVFVVDKNSYPVHRDRLFCGVKNPGEKIEEAFSIPADTLYTRICSVSAPATLSFFIKCEWMKKKRNADLEVFIK